MQQLDQKAVWLFFLGPTIKLLLGTIYMVVPGVITVIVSDVTFVFGFLHWVWVIIPVFLIFFWIWAKLAYHFYRYELREDGFRKELGVIWKKYVTIPYDRIQNVDIYRGVIARILGLSDLRIQTAGTSTHGVGAEGKLPGLSREVAEQLRDELIKRARQSKTTNQGL